MLNENMICKKELTFKSIKKGGHSIHINIELYKKELENKFDTNLNVIDNKEKNYILYITGKGYGHGSGQIIEGLKEEINNQSFSSDDLIKAKEILKIWEEFHLNTNCNGTNKQDLLLKRKNCFGQNYNYYKAIEILKRNNLYKDRDYKYGTSWLYKTIPNDVIEYIMKI